MKLLLDTHIWIWSLTAPENLSRRVLGELENLDNERWLSPLTIWEILLLGAKGRLRMNEPVAEWVERTTTAAQVMEAPLTREVALASRTLKVSHGDPVDWLLAATARAFDLTLVTADRNLIRARGFSVLPNR